MLDTCSHHVQKAVPAAQNISWLGFVRVLSFCWVAVGAQVSWCDSGVAAACTNGVLGTVLMLPSTCISRVEDKCTSVHFVCSELDFQQVVLSKQEIGYLGVETCCMVESLERHFGFHASIHLSFWHATGYRQWQSVFPSGMILKSILNSGPSVMALSWTVLEAAHSCL